MTRRLLVTGATGFTGRHVVPLLLERYGEVTCFVRPTSDCSAIALPGVSFATGSLDDEASLEAALRGHDTIVNIASLGFGHAEGIMAACHNAGITRGVFVSTTSIFTSLNADSKSVRQAAEEAVRDAGFATTILRPTMIYGTPGDRNMIRLIRFVHRAPVVPILGRGKYLQQPIHVEDLAQAIAACIDCEAAFGKSYNLSGKVPVSYNTVVDLVGAALGVRRFKIHLPVGFSLFAARLLNAVIGKPFVKEEQILRLNEDKAFDHGEAARDFGFAPRSFEEGIGQEVALWKNSLPLEGGG